jgi:DNA-binding NarL/FixJ family response regulator
MLRTLVADRDDTVRAGVHALLSMQSFSVSIEEVRSRDDLLVYAETGRFNLIIVEPLIDDGPSDALIRQLCAVAPHPNVLVFTALDELNHGVRAISCGAKGFLMKNCSVDEFLHAVERVRNGRTRISSALAEKCVKRKATDFSNSLRDTLSEREIDVYSMLITGKKVTEIARLLHLSAKTISTHKVRIFSKVSCKNLSEMINHAIAHELIGQCRARSDALMRK